MDIGKIGRTFREIMGGIAKAVATHEEWERCIEDDNDYSKKPVFRDDEMGRYAWQRDRQVDEKREKHHVGKEIDLGSLKGHDEVVQGAFSKAMKTQTRDSGFLRDVKTPEQIEEERNRREKRIHVLARVGTVEELRQEIRGGAKVEWRDDEARTPIIVAAQAGQTQNARYLIRKGAGIDAIDAEGRTALHYACRNRDIKLVEDLIAHGADIEHKGSGKTPLTEAVSVTENAAVVRFLLEAGARVKVRGSNGGSILHDAAAGSDMDTLRLLIAAGLSVETKDASGRLPCILGRTHQMQSYLRPYPCKR